MCEFKMTPIAVKNAIRIISNLQSLLDIPEGKKEIEARDVLEINFNLTYLRHTFINSLIQYEHSEVEY